MDCLSTKNDSIQISINVWEIIILCVWKNVNKSFDWPKSLFMWEGMFFTLQTFQTIVWILFWFKSSSEWNMRWLQTQSYFLYCVQKQLEQKKSIFPASATKIQKYLSVGNLRAKKIIYRLTDPLHISTVGLRQTNNFLRAALGCKIPHVGLFIYLNIIWPVISFFSSHQFL